jgi:hypothetical protein
MKDNGDIARERFLAKEHFTGSQYTQTIVDSPTVQRARAFLDRVGKMLSEKNRAYGDSAANPMRVFSRASATEGIRVRIDDKLSRLARGDGSGDEDAVADLVGYLALLVGTQET